MAAPAAAGLDCPFVGLEPYAKEHREYFFGRDRERRIIAANLYAARLSVLYGASGVGKSSILRAGVAEDLRLVPRTAVVYCHEWHDASFLSGLKQLCLAAVAAAGGQIDGVDPAAPLDELVAALQLRFRGSILFLLDQFEEYFLYHPEGEIGHDFDAELARTVNRSDLQASVLIALREDWLARLDRFRVRIPNLLGNMIRLAHLDKAAAEDAVRGPMRVWNERHPGAGAGVEDRLVGELIADVRAGRVSLSEAAGQGEAKGGRERDEIETAFLQLVLTRLWDAERQAGGTPFLRLATYEQLGRARRIVQTHLDELLDQLTPDERESCARMFPQLVTPGGSKIAHETSDLVVFSGRPRGETTALLTTLTGRRVLRRIAPPERYEIFHDVLAPAILDWCARHVQARELAQRAAEERQRAEARELAAREKELRNRRNAALIMAGALTVIVLMALAGWFAWQERRSLRQAESTRLLADADQLQDADYGASLLLNREAVRVNPALDTSAGVMRRFMSHPYLAAFLPGHKAYVQCVAFSPDGKWLASGGGDQTVILWDVRSRRLLATLSGHWDSVSSVAFSPDGKRLASGSWDRTVILWDLTSRKPLARLLGHKDKVSSVAFSPDGKRLASGSWDTTVILWDLDSRKRLATMAGHQKFVHSVAFSPDGKRLASAGGDEAVILWDVDGRKPPAKLVAHAGQIASIAFRPNGKQLASAGKDKAVTLWDLESRQPVARLAEQKDAIESIAFSPDGKRLASASWNRTVVVWDMDERQVLATLAAHKNEVLGVAFSPDGRWLASASVDNTVILWDMNGRNPLATLEGHAKAVLSVAFSPNGKLLASANQDQTVMLWDAESRKPLATLAGHRGEVNGVAFSPDGKLLASASADRTVMLWDVDSRRQLTTLQHRNLVRSVAFSPDGQRLASPDGDSVILWDVRSGKPLAALPGHKGFVLAVAFSPNGRLLASASVDKSVTLWDVGSGKPVAALSGHRAPAYGLAFSPDGTRLASASPDHTVILWDVDNRRRLAALEGPVGFYSVAFSPDGRLLASASQDGTLILWGVDQHKSLTSLTGHRGEVFGVGFSPDGKLLASASADQTVMLWDVDFSSLVHEACRTANRNLTCEEWRSHFGPEEPYRKSCEMAPGPERCN